MENGTLLFDKIIFGPLLSRRLGRSLGINLLPLDSKLCNFDCVYCECGWSISRRKTKKRFHSREDVKENLQHALQELKQKGGFPDSITFAGNGEPTMHPQFDKIMEDTVALRNSICPSVKIAVLSNASYLNRENVMRALRQADLRIMKLDAGTEKMFALINRPSAGCMIRRIADHLRYFKGEVIIQSLFLKGWHKGKWIDNTRERELREWLSLIAEINPELVMIYSIERATPEKNLQKIPEDKLHEIAKRVKLQGIKTQVS